MHDRALRDQSIHVGMSSPEEYDRSCMRRLNSKGRRGSPNGICTIVQMRVPSLGRCMRRIPSETRSGDLLREIAHMYIVHI